MSTHLFAFDEPFYDHANTNSSLLFTNEPNDLQFLSDPFSGGALSDNSSIDSIILEEISGDQNTSTQHHHHNNNHPPISISLDEAESLGQIAKTLLSNSPPSNQLENLSLCHQDSNLMGNLTNLANGYTTHDYSSLPLEVKTEESSGQSQLSFESSSYNDNHPAGCYFFGSYGGSDSKSMLGFLQRSYSSNSFEVKPGFMFHHHHDQHHQPRFEPSFLIEQCRSPVSSATTTTGASSSSPFQVIITNSSDSSSFSNAADGGGGIPAPGHFGQMRRVCSTGDIPKVKSGQTTQQGGGEQQLQQQQKLSSSPLGTEGNNGNTSFMEDANFKVGRYSAEERKERIDRYRAKRTQRNFNKTIKYACRKTLADNRPRIRGRFVRNDETPEIPIPKASSVSASTPLSLIHHHHGHHNNQQQQYSYEDEDDLSWVTESHEEDDEQGAAAGTGKGSGRRGRFLNNFGGMTQYQHQYCGY